MVDSTLGPEYISGPEYEEKRSISARRRVRAALFLACVAAIVAAAWFTVPQALLKMHIRSLASGWAKNVQYFAKGTAYPLPNTAVDLFEAQVTPDGSHLSFIGGSFDAVETGKSYLQRDRASGKAALRGADPKWKAPLAELASVANVATSKPGWSLVDRNANGLESLELEGPTSRHTIVLEKDHALPKSYTVERLRPEGWAKTEEVFFGAAKPVSPAVSPGAADMSSESYWRRLYAHPIGHFRFGDFERNVLAADVNREGIVFLLVKDVTAYVTIATRDAKGSEEYDAIVKPFSADPGARDDFELPQFIYIVPRGDRKPTWPVHLDLNFRRSARSESLVGDYTVNFAKATCDVLPLYAYGVECSPKALFEYRASLADLKANYFAHLYRDASGNPVPADEREKVLHPTVQARDLDRAYRELVTCIFYREQIEKLTGRVDSARTPLWITARNLLSSLGRVQDAKQAVALARLAANESVLGPQDVRLLRRALRDEGMPEWNPTVEKAALKREVRKRKH